MSPVPKGIFGWKKASADEELEQSVESKPERS